MRFSGIIFLFELLLRLYFHRLRYFTNPVTRAWNVADFIIVSVPVVDTMILIPFGVGGTARARDSEQLPHWHGS